MIQEAQIGVGISGKEGRQAVNNADFASAQFRFLKPLLLHHGRRNYRRTSKVIIYFFFKNIARGPSRFASYVLDASRRCSCSCSSSSRTTAPGPARSSGTTRRAAG
mgnify:CR=1 FL=1